MFDEGISQAQIILLYVPCKNKEEAKNIAKILLSEKMVACANIIPSMDSLYMWSEEAEEPSLQDTQESLLLMKCPAISYEKVKARILELHSYILPCIAGFSLSYCNKEYKNWVEENTY